MVLAITDGGRWDASRMPSMEGKLVLITGANAGIGFETTKAMASKGAHVILGCRNEKRGRAAERAVREATGSALVDFMQLDVGSLASIKAFAEAFHARFDHVDLLINNAGVAHPIEATTIDGFEAHFGVNHLGHFYLVSLLFDLLKQAPGEARVVTVSSTNHRYVDEATDFRSIGMSKSGKSGKMNMDDYSVSKLCNLLFTYELGCRLKRAAESNPAMANIKAVAAHPGITMTNIIADSVKANRLPAWMQRVFTKTVAWLPIFQTPEVGSLTSLYAASVPSVASGDYIGPNGWHSFWGYPKLDESSPLSHSKDAAAALWARSEELLQIKFDVL